MGAICRKNFQINAFTNRHIYKVTPTHDGLLSSKYNNELNEYQEFFLIQYGRVKTLLNANKSNTCVKFSLLKHRYFDQLSEQSCTDKTMFTKCDQNGILLCRDSRKINPPRCNIGE
ncbi:hypothetical protein HZS_1297, partial [Henneguya salminicola]